MLISHGRFSGVGTERVWLILLEGLLKELWIGKFDETDILDIEQTENKENENTFGDVLTKTQPYTAGSNTSIDLGSTSNLEINNGKGSPSKSKYCNVKPDSTILMSMMKKWKRLTHWEFRLKTALAEQGLESCLVSCEEPNTDADVKEEKNAQAIIVQSVADSHLELIKECESAYKMYQQLQENYRMEGVAFQDPNPRGQAEVLLIDGQSPPHVQSPHQRRSTISLRPTCRARIIAAPPITKWIVVDRACITRNQWSTISLRHKDVSPHHRSRLLFWKPNLADYNSTFHQATPSSLYQHSDNQQRDIILLGVHVCHEVTSPHRDAAARSFTSQESSRP
ncbi:hypothetical protein ACJJTC_005194 [Scirpophaga incertulas]